MNEVIFFLYMVGPWIFLAASVVLMVISSIVLRKSFSVYRKLTEIYNADGTKKAKKTWFNQ